MANRNPKFKDETGKRFGMLTVLRYVGVNSRDVAMFECKCDCGNIIQVPGIQLRAKQRTSCGCKKFMPRKPKADFCVVCGSHKVYVKNMCRRCYFKQWREKHDREMERYL